jgi:RNA polymerase sigma-70 factor (ECF subfamily)
MATDALAEFDAHRRRLFGVAYRMLGSASDADDIVQDAWIKWADVDHEAVRDPGAFLMTMVTRLAVNAATSAYARRVTYPGPWLPEPVDTESDPAIGALRAEAMDFAVVRLLEQLSPTERAVFVLREAFDYSFADISEVVEIAEATARQVFRRARAHLQSRRPVAVDADEHRRLLDAFLGAVASGEMARLEAVLTESVVALSDGGGKVTAARVPVVGRGRVAQFLLGVVAKFGQDLAPQIVEVNGRAAVLFTRDGVVAGVCTIDATWSGIESVMIVLEPGKLAHLARVMPVRTDTPRTFPGRTPGPERG